VTKSSVNLVRRHFSGEKLREDVESVKIKIPYIDILCVVSMHR